jgi:hypothetical protein
MRCHGGDACRASDAARPLDGSLSSLGTTTTSLTFITPDTTTSLTFITFTTLLHDEGSEVATAKENAPNATTMATCNSNSLNFCLLLANKKPQQV